MGVNKVTAFVRNLLGIKGTDGITIASKTNPVPTADAHADLFGNNITGSRNNQIEVHFDDTNWATYVSTTQTGGGGASQHEGHVHFTSSTGANGRSKAVTIDTIRYRPMSEAYAGWTATFATAGIANSFMRIGLADTDYNNGVVIGYEETAFGISWFVNGVKTFIPQASWDDPCLGGAASRFTRNGAPEALNPAYSNIYRVRYGWLGAAGFVVDVFAPDGEWIPIYTLKRANSDSEPFFTNPDLTMIGEVNKTGAGSTNLDLRSNCWAGGATSQMARLSDVITDRSLAQTVRAVLECRTNSGSYTKVLVNSQGRLQVTNDSVGATAAATPASATLIGGTDGTNLRALRLDADGRLPRDNAFATLLHFLPTSISQEMKRDETATDDYHGRAPDGALTSDPVWEVVRFYKTLGLITRVRYRSGVVWDNRATGWT